MIQVLAIYILPLAFVLAFAAYTKYQIIDEDDGAGWTHSETMWHRCGLVMRACVALMGLAWVLLPAPPVKHYLLSAGICAAAFDIGINLFRGRPIFDVGQGGSDARIGKWKWVGYVIYFITVVLIFYGSSWWS